MESKTNYNKLAKKYDKIGKWAIRGMDSFVAQYFNIKPYSCGGSEINSVEAIEYITETYLECIDSVSFEDWITKGNDDGQVLILSEYDFKEKYSEIFEINQSLQGAIDDIAILYDCEWWIFAMSEYEPTYFVTTTYQSDYNKLNLTEVHKAMSYFSAFIDIDIVTNKVREDFVKRINKATNNFLNNYKINEMNDFELFELVDYKLGLGYC